ncbi:MAG TPA: asparagine synthetase B [Candidatus Pullichristensenella excrementipullorum]|nr:asparagine synthetase B [Candidatus Pullichristensenella excrementipullorum]
MELLGIFHKKTFMEARGVCEAPYIEKGGHALSARDAATSGGVMACALGRMRNAAKLAEELGLMREERSLARIVLAAYARWGEDYIEHIEGPVLTAVLDRDADALILCRDRMGERRVFYTAQDGCVAFADHPDMLLEAGCLRPVVDIDGLRELFGLGPARTPGKTPWRGMYALEPGCALVARGESARVRRYFRLEAREHEDDAAATVETVRMMIERAVDDIAPLRPAAMLSGGIDSTLLTALLRQRMEPVRSFSVDYEGNDRHFRANAFQPARDAPYIALAVERIGCQHTAVELTQASLAQALEEAVDARGFPGMADVDSSLLLFARRIAPQARFALSGECGDEVFGGYPWFRDAHSISGESFPWSGSLELRAGVLRRRVREKLDIREYVRGALSEAISRVEHLPHESAEGRCLRTMQHMCFAFFMANLQERALAMCEHSHLGVLTPFADERLVQYIYNVPWEMKFMGGREKGLLREAAGALLPESLRYRRKSPYPKTCDPAYARIVCGMVQGMLAEKKSPILQLVDARALEKLAASDLSPAQTPWFGQLMAGPQMLAYLWQVNAWLAARHAEVAL